MLLFILTLFSFSVAIHSVIRLVVGVNLYEPISS